jgi:GNAT superfamily N-acetyltransferase
VHVLADRVAERGPVQQSGLDLVHGWADTRQMRFTVEPSPAGGYHVRMEGSPVPLSHHDTLEDAEARLAAYRRGAAQPRGELVDLPDGSEVLVRPVRPDDKPLFAAAWERFGDESRYRRFMAAKNHLSPTELAHLTEVDHVDHEAIGALHPRTGAGLGVARYLRNRDRPTTADAAVAVIDDWQGRGLGGVLLRRLSARARANGIETFTASLLTENRSMLRLFERLGRVDVRSVEGPTMEIDVELPVEDARTVLRSTATHHIRPSDRRSAGG